MSNLELTAWFFALVFICAIGFVVWYLNRKPKKSNQNFFNLKTGHPVTEGQTKRRSRQAYENDVWLQHQSTIGTLDTSTQDDKCSTSSDSRSDCSRSSGSSSFGGTGSSFSSSGGGSSGSSFD